MDLQKIIKDVLEKLSSDDVLKDTFFTDPTAVLEKLIGIDLPNDQINAIIDGVKAKLKLDDVADKAQDIMGALGGLFGKSK